MSDVSREYRDIIEAYLSEKMAIGDLVDVYLRKFKSDYRKIPDEEFYVLDEIFACLDCLTTDVDLIAEKPDFHLNENQLKDHLVKALARLS
jgi:hypothetical protein